MTTTSLGPITCVTITTPDVSASEAAYVENLGYQLVSRGHVTRAVAENWQSPAAEGARFAVLRPDAPEGFAFRFVESPSSAGYTAFSCFGWNAAELIVRDVDAMAQALAHSAFEILGAPQDLSFTDAIRAMQVRGPSGEILYLTQFKRPLVELPSPPARCDVDRVFIVIVGGRSLEDLLEFYDENFSISAPQRMESRVKAMSEVFGLPAEHRYSIAALPLAGGCYIEADQMPATATAPVVPAGNLPPGIAIVSFRNDTRQAPGCIRGAAGEILELLPA